MDAIVAVGSAVSAPLLQATVMMGPSGVGQTSAPASANPSSVVEFENMVDQPSSSASVSSTTAPASAGEVLGQGITGAFEDMRTSFARIDQGLSQKPGGGNELMYMLSMQRNLMFATVAVELYSKMGDVATQDVQTLLKNQ